MYVPVTYTTSNVPKLPNGRHILAGNIQIYIRDGKKHRENGPAEVHPNGYKAWFKNGLRHRDNLPAIVHPNGVKDFYINGKFIRTEEK